MSTETMSPATMNPEEISKYASEVANIFRTEGMKQLDHLILNEKAAKEMIIAGFAYGKGNVLVAGEPGGGKSTLLQHAHRIIGGIEDDDVAFVPHRTDLTAAQLVGDYTDATKTTDFGDGSPTVEKIGASISPIISSEKKVIVFDEITRGNPMTLNAALGVLASRTIVVRGVTMPLDNLELIAAAMNPEESLTSSFRGGAALASRMTMGAQLGNTSEHETDYILDELWENDWEPTPDQMKSVITLDDLHLIRKSISRVIIDPAVKKEGKEISKLTRTALGSGDIASKEAIGRLSTDIRSIAKTLALLRGNTVVKPQDLHDAVLYRITGAITMRGGNGSDVDSVMGQIYKG